MGLYVLRAHNISTLDRDSRSLSNRNRRSSKKTAFSNQRGGRRRSVRREMKDGDEVKEDSGNEAVSGKRKGRGYGKGR